MRKFFYQSEKFWKKNFCLKFPETQSKTKKLKEFNIFFKNKIFPLFWRTHLRWRRKKKMQGELAQVQWVSLHMQGASFPLHPLHPCPNPIIYCYNEWKRRRLNLNVEQLNCFNLLSHIQRLCDQFLARCFKWERFSGTFLTLNSGKIFFLAHIL